MAGGYQVSGLLQCCSGAWGEGLTRGSGWLVRRIKPAAVTGGPLAGCATRAGPTQARSAATRALPG